MVLILFYGALYRHIDLLNNDHPEQLIHYSAVYLLLDALLLLFSFFHIGAVKGKSRELIENRRFKEYNTEAEIALSDILYFPQ